MASLKSIFNRYSPYIQVAPLLVVLLLFLIGPLIVIGIISFFEFTGYFTRPGFEFTAYTRIFSQYDLTLANYWTTIRLTAITWVITLVLGFTIAYFFVFDLITLKVKIFLFLITIVPFWTSGVVRIISWLPFLGRMGQVRAPNRPR